MREGITPSGFGFAYPEENADDMRLVDALAVVMDDEADSFDKISAASRAAELLLGKKQKQALYSHIGKSHAGRVPAEALFTELEAVMLSGKDAEKNC